MHKLLISITLFLTYLNMTAYAQLTREIVYVGTYSLRGSEGIYVFEKKFIGIRLLQAFVTTS